MNKIFKGDLGASVPMFKERPIPRIPRSNGHCRNLRIFFPLLSCIFGLLDSRGLSQTTPAYEAFGEIVYRTGKNLENEERRPFQMVVSGSTWSIQVQEGLSGVKFRGVACESNTLYYFGELSKDPSVKNSSIATIEYGMVPVENGTLAPLAWLALASSSYFQTISNSMVQPLWNVREVQKRRVKCEWEVYDSLPKLPKKVVYHGEAGVFPPPFNDGRWIAAQYSVETETNFQGLTLPLAGTYTQFVPRPSSGTTERQFEVRILVGQIRPTQDRRLVPAMTGVTFLSEQRFRESNPPVAAVMYEFTNGILPEQPDAASVRLYQRHLAQAKAAAVSTGTKRTVIRFGIFLFMVLSAVALWFTVRKRNAKQNPS